MNITHDVFRKLQKEMELKHQAVEKDLGEAKRNLMAVTGNEYLTRGRVETLEGVLARPFLGRLRWLLTGK